MEREYMGDSLTVTVLYLGSILDTIPLHYCQKTRILRTESSELLSLIRVNTIVCQHRHTYIQFGCDLGESLSVPEDSRFQSVSKRHVCCRRRTMKRKKKRREEEEKKNFFRQLFQTKLEQSPHSPTKCSYYHTYSNKSESKTNINKTGINQGTSPSATRCIALAVSSGMLKKGLCEASNSPVLKLKSLAVPSTMLFCTE